MVEKGPKEQVASKVGLKDRGHLWGGLIGDRACALGTFEDPVARSEGGRGEERSQVQAVRCGCRARRC